MRARGGVHHHHHHLPSHSVVVVVVQSRALRTDERSRVMSVTASARTDGVGSAAIATRYGSTRPVRT